MTGLITPKEDISETEFDSSFWLYIPDFVDKIGYFSG